MSASRLLRIVALLVPLSVVLAGCGAETETVVDVPESPTEEGPRDPAAETEVDEPTAVAEDVPAPEEVVIAVVGGPSGFYVTNYAALGIGAIDEVAEKYGFEVSYEEYASGGDTRAAMVAGRVDYTLGDGGQSLASVIAGQPLIGLLEAFKGPGAVVIGAKQFEEERGNDISSYDGARWGFTTAGSLTDILNQLVAEGAGLDWADQEALPLGSHAGAVTALAAGRVDIVSTLPGVAAAAIAAGDAYLIMNPNDPTAGFEFYDVANPILFRREFAEQYPEVTADLVAAELRGIMAVQDADNAEAVAALLPEHFPIPETWAEEWDLLRPSLADIDGYMTEQQIATTVRLTQLIGVEVPPELDTDSVFSNDFVIEAYELLGLTPPNE